MKTPLTRVAILILWASSVYAADKQWDRPPRVDPEEFKLLLQTADDPMFQHPVLSVGDVKLDGSYPEWKRWPVMQMSKDEILKLIPQQVGLIHLGCPECNAGPENAKHDFNDSSQLPRQWRHWRWDWKNPESYTCSKCGERFPDNPKYPMEHVDTFHNRLGEAVERRYWLDTAKDKKGFEKRYPKYYLNSQIDYFKQRWTGGQLRNLRKAYILTGDESFAYKAAILFDAMCEVFPHWLYMANYAHNYKDYRPGLRMKSTYTRTNSRRGEDWGGPIGMKNAYDVFFNSEGFAQYSREIGVDLRAKYLTYVVKFIKPSLFTEGKLPDINRDGWQQGCPGHGGIATGKLLHDPRYMRRFAEHMLRIPFVVHGSDGAYFEGSGYTCLQLNPMMKMRDMNGYSDPKGFVPPKGEERLENWWYPQGHYETFHRKAYNLQRELALPTGGAVVYNDAGGGFPSASYIQQTRKPRSFNVMKHGLKHVVLGDGAGADQIQAHLLFGLDSKHGHSDTMSLQIFAKGHYLIDDITYPKHRMRSTYGDAILHNTGLIDGRGHAKGPIGDGKPVLYEPRFNGLAAVRIDGENLYPGYANGAFERTLVSVTVDPERPYVVDLFRMNGGRRWREYMLLGPYRHRCSEAKLSVPATKLPGVRPLMREGAKWDDAGKDDVRYDDVYGLFTNVRAAPKGRDFTLTYTLRDTWRQKTEDGQPTGKPKDLYLDPEKPPVGIANHFIGMPDATPYLTDIPRRVDEHGPTVTMEQMPQLIYRDEGMDTESQFVCVHEPFTGRSTVKRVSRLPAAGNALALRVEFTDGREDLVLMSTDKERLSYDDNGVRTDARVAVISRPAQGTVAAWMIGGTRLSARGVSLGCPADGYRGTIVKSLRKWDGDNIDGFEVAGELPANADALVGAWVMVDTDGVQDEFHDWIINGSIDEWYKKYHSRSNKKDTAAWKDDQRRWEACKKMGAGWAFEIKDIIRRGGRTYLVTKEDHGLKVDGDSRFAQELFFPRRQFKESDTTWWINTAASTLPLKSMIPKRLLVMPANVPTLKKVLMPYPQDGNRYYRFIEPDSPEDYEAEVIVDGTNLDAAKPKDARPGIIHCLGHRRYENGQFAGMAYSGYAGVSDGEMRRYIFRPKGGEQHFKGYLEVPADGIYTFYYRAGGNGELLVGGHVVSPENRYHGAPYPRVIQIKLAKGHVPVEFWSSMRGAKYWSANNEIDWEGPGFARRPMEFGDFVYSQADLDAMAAKVAVNKLKVDDESRYTGIRNDYLAAVAYGGGEVYLNGKPIGQPKGGKVWTHSINLRAGDVLVLKTDVEEKHVGAGLAGLHRGKPSFGSTDCMLTAEEPGNRFFTHPGYEDGLARATPDGVGENVLRRDDLAPYHSDPVWRPGAQTIWLKHVVQR